MLLCRFYGGAQKRVVGDWCEGAVKLKLMHEVGVGACALTGDDIHKLKIVAQRTGRAYADDIINIIEIVQLPAVDTDGRNAHAACHNGHGNALPCAGVTLNAADIVHEYGILKEGFCYEFGSERIAGHEHRFCDILFFCRYVRSGNRHFVSSSNNKFGFAQIISVMRGLVKFCSRAAIKNPYRFRPSSA